MAAKSTLRRGSIAVLAIIAGCSRPTATVDPPADQPERVIALAPSAVETICALGWCDRLVGVGSYVTHPAKAAGLPRLGGLVDADLERILLLEPDLVVLLESEADLAGKLTRLGVEVLSVPADSLADIGEAAESVARRLGDPERGRTWARELEEALRPQAPGTRARALLVVGRPPGTPVKLMVPGEDTYLGELVRKAGARPAVTGFGTSYRQVDLAAALAARPEVILEFGFEPDAAADALAADWRVVYPEAEPSPCHRVVSGSHVVVPGPRVVALYQDILAALESCR